MGEKGLLNLTRRKFMALGSAVLAAPMLRNISGTVPAADAAEKKAEKQYDFVDKKECDVVVLGGGGSGMIAAVRAAELSGKKVIILEKDKLTGGAALYATGVRIFGSKFQAKNNQEDNSISYAREQLDALYWRLDEKLVYNCYRGTGQFFDWLLEQGGDIEGLFNVVAGTGMMAGVSINTQKAGKKMPPFVMSLMKEKCAKYGVEVLTNHPAVDVEVKDGKIVAVIDKSDKGYVRVACKACIMSIGSWINNDEIVKKYAPKFYGKTKYMDASPHWATTLTGDGIAFAQKVGAFIDYDSFVMRYMGPMLQGMASQTMMTMGRNSGYHITVNLNGKRYCCEPISRMGEFNGGEVQVEQPNGVSYIIFDENAVEAMLKKQKATSSSSQGSGQSMPGGAGSGGGAPTGAQAAGSGAASGGAPTGAQAGGSGAPGGGAPTGAASGGAPTGAQAGGTGGAPSGGAPTGGAPTGDFTGGRGGSSIPDTMEAIHKDIAEGLAKDTKNFFKGDTLEELADKIGVNKKNFLETVKKYNECCAKGVDDEFFKEKDNLIPINKAPYYASRGFLGTDGAFGGVRVNPDIQAYKADGKTLVEGLYVTGDFASGRHVNMGGVKHQVINDCTWAFSSGFLAGTNAAKYVKKI